MSLDSESDWPRAVFDRLRAHAVEHVAYVPDAGHRRLIQLCETEPSMQTVPLTTEEEGVALLAGSWLGGKRGLLLMQSSGAGNCINMLSLTRTCRFPLLLLITMRGEAGEFNPWQVPMGEITGKTLELAGVHVERAESAAEVAPRVDEAAGLAFATPTARAVLIAQQVIGVKTFDQQDSQ